MYGFLFGAMSCQPNVTSQALSLLWLLLPCIAAVTARPDQTQGHDPVSDILQLSQTSPPSCPH